MEYSCEMCGKAFKGKPSGRGKFCSPSCYHMSQEKPKETRTCGTCGAAFVVLCTRPTTYCSKKCLPVLQRVPVHFNCEQCGKAFVVNPSRAKYARFCSYSCRSRKLSVGITTGIRAAVRLTPPSPYNSYYHRQASRVRRRDNYQCQNCGQQFCIGDSGLEVHHKIPVRAGGTHNLKNLESLCKRCHRATDRSLIHKTLADLQIKGEPTGYCAVCRTAFYGFKHRKYCHANCCAKAKRARDKANPDYARRAWRRYRLYAVQAHDA